MPSFFPQKESFWRFLEKDNVVDIAFSVKVLSKICMHLLGARALKTLSSLAGCFVLPAGADQPTQLTKFIVTTN